MFKTTRADDNAIATINSTIPKLLVQQQILFLANDNSPIAGAGVNFDGLLTFRILYKVVVMGNNTQGLLNPNPAYNEHMSLFQRGLLP